MRIGPAAQATAFALLFLVGGGIGACTTVRSEVPAAPTPATTDDEQGAGSTTASPRPTGDDDRPTSTAANREEATETATEDEPVDRFPEAMFEETNVDPQLDRAIRSIVDRPPYDQMFWGIHVRDMHDGAVLYERNAHRKFVPASNAKVLVVAAALEELGPDYRYETGLWATRPLRGSTVEGPLVLDGRGDPTLSDRFQGNWRDAIAGLADLVYTSGVRRITGPLLIDASRWDSTSVPETWMVGDIGWAFAASGGPFVIDEGRVQAVVLGGNEPGDPARVDWSPDLGPERLVSDVVTGDSDSTFLRPDYRSATGQIVLGGFVPPGRRKVERLAVRDPVRVAGELLADALRFRGIRIDGGVRFAWEPGEDLGSGCLSGAITSCSSATRIARLQSAPLIEIAHTVLAPSQNWVTEQLVRTLGAERGERGSWPEGIRVIEETLSREFSVLSRDLQLRDGSGLSAYNLVTPRALTDILFRARIMDYGPAFRDALASPGEQGSTLQRRLTGLEDRLFAKTGTITHVNSLSGYLVRDNGREVVFSILTNSSGLETRDMRRAIDELLRELARY